MVARTLPLLLVVLSAGACSGAKPTTPQTLAHADPERGECGKAPGALSAVLLRPEQRADLEAAMRDGVALVRLEGCRLEVIADCRASARYEEALQPATDDRVELRAGPDLARVLDGDRLARDVERGGAEIHTRTVRTLSVDTSNIGPAALTGSRCDRVTHAVTKASLGAFVVRRSAGSSPAFSMGAGAGSAADDERTLAAGGRDCADEKKPCHGEIVSVELAPIGGQGGDGAAESETIQRTKAPAASGVNRDESEKTGIIAPH